MKSNFKKAIICFPFLLLLIFVISACNKFKKTTIVKGKVIDYVTHKPIEGATIVLFDNSFYASHSHISDEAITDSEGNYIIETDEGGYGVGLSDYYYMDKNGKDIEYHDGYLCFGFDSIKNGKTNTKDFIDYSPVAQYIILYRISQLDSIKLIHVNIVDEKLNVMWKDSAKRVYNEKLKVYLSTCEVRANDSLLVRVSRSKNGLIINQEYKYYFRAFMSDTLYVNF